MSFITSLLLMASSPAPKRLSGRTTTVGVVQGHFPALPESCLVAVLTRPLRERPVGLVRSLL